MQGNREGSVERSGKSLQQDDLINYSSFPIREDMLQTGEPSCQLGPVSKVRVALDELGQLLIPFLLLFGERF